jgi:hypothetical protein
MTNTPAPDIRLALFDGRSPHNTSKMWILPSGRVHNTEHNLHFRWALANRPLLAGTYGIDVAPLRDTSTEDEVRHHLIKQGLFRVNHDARRNLVTFEGLQSRFTPEIRATIAALVAAFPDCFAELRINLFDDAVTTTTQTLFRNWFACSPEAKHTSILTTLNPS